MELFVVGMAVGGLLGVKGKGIVKSAAKGYFTLMDRSREVGKNLREDFRDAVEEAKYEHEQQVARAEEDAFNEAESEHEQNAVYAEADGPTPDARNGRHSENKPLFSTPTMPGEGSPVVQPAARKKPRNTHTSAVPDPAIAQAEMVALDGRGSRSVPE